MKKTFLHVGCGPLTKENTTLEFNSNDWEEIRVDIDAAVKPDIVASMTDMSSVDSNSFDAVYSSHNIEHLFPHEVPIALSEMNRALKDDGFLIITCPDLQSVCAKVADGNLVGSLYQSGMGPITALDILYGHRVSLAKGNHYMAHKVGFTKEVLQSTLINAGFKHAVVAAVPVNFVLWGIASKNSDDDPSSLFDDLKKHTEQLQ
jgi:predicted SAM-dependent methyltransferase